MKIWIAALALLLASSCYAQTAQSYFTQLQKAHGLDGWADEYVCFDDSPNDFFFTFTKSKDIETWMQADGKLSKFPADFRKMLREDILIDRDYKRGVALGGRNFFNHKADSWQNDPISYSNHDRLRVDITLQDGTMRFRRAVEVSKAGGPFLPFGIEFGRCSSVQP